MDSREANKNSNHPTKFTQLKGTPNSANSKVREVTTILQMLS